KAQRLRSIQNKKVQKVADEAHLEFVGIINYSLMALIQIEKGVVDQPDLSFDEAVEVFEKQVERARNLMLDKNHDYGEAWRDMRISSLTDLILQKLLRVKQIEDNQGKTIASEGIEANYLDMINYAIFALILENEKTE
ncbi:MAG: nucleotide modification associated domain-containing protein, partial [Psychroflexus maritimus]